MMIWSRTWPPTRKQDGLRMDAAWLPDLSAFMGSKLRAQIQKGIPLAALPDIGISYELRDPFPRLEICD